MPRKSEIAADPDRFVFVRDGFHFWAFLLGPLWMLWHRLWLVLLIYVVGSAALQMGLFALGAVRAGEVRGCVADPVLIGFEAGSLRRWSLRRRWTQVGVVAARDLEEAERRFFEAWSGDTLPPAPAMFVAIAPPPVSSVRAVFARRARAVSATRTTSENLKSDPGRS